MVAINQIALPATVVLGLVSQALALPVQATQDIVESGLLERAIDAEIEERAIDDVDVDMSERDELEPRFFRKALSFGKKMLFGREAEELSERDIAEIVERYIDESDLETRDIDSELEEREAGSSMTERALDDLADELTARYNAGEISERGIGGFFKKIAKGVGKVASVVLRDDIEELSEREVEEELNERGLNDLADELTARYNAGEISERGIGGFFKKIAKGVGKVASVVLRDETEEELSARDIVDISERDINELADELTARYYAGEIDERSIGGFFKKVAKGVGKAASFVLRDDIEELTERDFDEELSERALDDIADELTARYYAGELDERGIGGFFKKVAKGVGKAASFVLRDDIEELSERDFEEELSERDIVDLEDRDLNDLADELTARYYAGEISERGIGGFFKKVAKGVGKVASFVLRDEVEELSEREIEEEIFARYYDGGELDLE